ncbi:MAG: STAS domain-containing protein [Pseudomonadota bacterium]
MNIPAENRKTPRSAVLRINSKRLNLANSAQVSQEGEDLIAAGATELVVDCSTVTMVDSSGIGTLVGLRKKIGEGGNIVLRSPQPFVRKVLHLTKTDTLFEIR